MAFFPQFRHPTSHRRLRNQLSTKMSAFISTTTTAPMLLQHPMHCDLAHCQHAPPFSLSLHHRSHLAHVSFHRRSSFYPSTPLFHLRKSNPNHFLKLSGQASYRLTPTSSLSQMTPALTLLTSLTTQVTSTVAGLLLLGFIILIHESGHYLAARFQGIKVQSFSVGFGPKLLSWFPSWGQGTEFNLRVLPFGGFVAFYHGVEEEEDDVKDNDKEKDVRNVEYDKNDPDFLQNRPILDRAIVISAGVIANVILAWMCTFTSVSAVGVSEFLFKPGVVISEVVDTDGPGAHGGIQKGDVITKVDDVDVQGGPKSAGEVARKIRTSGGRMLKFHVLRDGADVDLKVLPIVNKVGGEAVIGVQLEPNALVKRQRPTSISRAISMTNQEFELQTRQTVEGIGSIFMNFKDQAGHLAGPVGVVSKGADLARNDTAALLTFAAIISLNLAIINALPIPALDGGQMVFLLIEALKGSPISEKFQDAVNRTCLLLFLAFSGVLLFADLEKLKIFSTLQKLFG